MRHVKKGKSGFRGMGAGSLKESPVYCREQKKLHRRANRRMAKLVIADQL